MEVNDSKINELIDRANEYRSDLAKTTDEIKIFSDLNLEEIQKIFKEKSDNFEIKDKRNVFVQYNITEDEANNGCMKKIKFNRININGKKEVNEIFIKIPAGIKRGENIIMYGEGNYIKELNINSDLIVEIK